MIGMGRSMSLPAIYTSALLLVTLGAARFGGWAAKRASVAYLMAQLALMVAPKHSYQSFETAFFLIDLLLFGVVIQISVRSKKKWPVACAILQTITVMGEAMRLADPMIGRVTYYILVSWTAWPALLVLMTGTWLDHRARDISQKC